MLSTFSISVAAQRLGVTVKTMQRWDRDGRLKPAARTSTNRRVYNEAQLQAYLGLKQTVGIKATRVIVYCRVSSSAQRPDLRNQRKILEEFVVARGISNAEFIEEIGGGLNFKRKHFVALMDAIGRREIATLVVAHKDRLTRFGFDWFEHFVVLHGCELLVLNQERVSPEQEMVQDLMTIVHCFSSRLYGLRNYRKKLDEALAQSGATISASS